MGKAGAEEGSVESMDLGWGREDGQQKFSGGRGILAMMGVEREGTPGSRTHRVKHGCWKTRGQQEGS